MHNAPGCPGERCLNALWVFVCVWRMTSGNPHQSSPMSALPMTVPCHREHVKASRLWAYLRTEQLCRKSASEYCHLFVRGLRLNAVPFRRIST